MCRVLCVEGVVQCGINQSRLVVACAQSRPSPAAEATQAAEQSQASAGCQPRHVCNRDQQAQLSRSASRSFWDPQSVASSRRLSCCAHGTHDMQKHSLSVGGQESLTGSDILIWTGVRRCPRRQRSWAGRSPGCSASLRCRRVCGGRPVASAGKTHPPGSCTNRSDGAAAKLQQRRCTCRHHCASVCIHGHL